MVAVPILYDAYYLGSGGGGVSGGGGDVPPKIPPPLIGTPDGCDADESLCYLIPGDDTNVLYYSSGEGGTYTVDASGCQQTASSFVSKTDGKICSTWQIYFYTGQYVGQTPNPPPPSLPGVIDAISIHVATANSQYPNGQNGQVSNGGHLYIEYWSNHVPVLPAPLQGGRDGTKLRPEPYQQNVLGDPHFYFALPRAQALSLSQTLSYKRDQYNAHTPGDAAPAYDYLNLNSNSWADGLLLSSGISPGTIDQFVAHLNAAAGGTRYPYGYGTGNTLVHYF
ncbi:MAG: hypothetical protein JWM87_1006 [Candidatus Eremiobacteraeota bacterium]|nr:hypothetical protein [Candidatus Eremiobacteraeota bacterium]